MNTKNHGKIRIIIYREDSLYYASALELNITSSGEDKNLAMYNLDEAIKGYIDFAKLENMDYEVLNQSTDPDLEKMWTAFQNNSIVKSPIHVVSTSIFETEAFA